MAPRFQVFMRSTVLMLLLLPQLAMAKTEENKEKAGLQAAFKKLVEKYEAAKKAAPLTPRTCADSADEFIAFGKAKNLPEAWLNGGMLYETCGGDIKKAEDAYRGALAINHDFAPGHVNLGEILYKRGDLPGAQGEFDTALKIDPKNVQAYNGQGLMLVEKAKANGNDKATYTEAVGKLRRALAIDADSIVSYSLLAHIYFTIAEADRSKLELAELVCKQAKEVNDKYPPIFNTLGLIKLRRKNVTGALKEFRAAAALDPAYIEAQLNIGAITLSVRDYASAAAAFKAVLDAKPTNPQQTFDATMGMGVAVRGQRHPEEAEQWYIKAQALDPKACAVNYNMGVLYQDYRSSEDNSHLNKAKALFNEFLTCGRAAPDKLDDAKRRIKDVDDTFKALAEAKVLEAEQKKMAEEAAAMQKVADEQACQYWNTQVADAMKTKTPTPPPPNDKCGPLPAGAIPPLPQPADPANGGAAPGAAPAAATTPAAPAAEAAPAPAAEAAPAATPGKKHRKAR